MKWELATIDRYIGAKEYIDTALVPIVQLDLGESMKDSLQKSTALLSLLSYIEEQLQGRMMLFPMLTYIEQGSTILVTQLEERAEYAKRHGFQYVVFASVEEMYKNDVISLPSEQLILSHYIDDFTVINQDLIRKKGEDMLSFFMNLWQKG